MAEALQHDPPAQLTWLSSPGTRNNKAAAYFGNGFGTGESCFTLKLEVDLLDGAGHSIKMECQLHSIRFALSFHAGAV
jgi:hypothetical protein